MKDGREGKKLEGLSITSFHGEKIEILIEIGSNRYKIINKTILITIRNRYKRKEMKNKEKNGGAEVRSAL